MQAKKMRGNYPTENTAANATSSSSDLEQELTKEMQKQIMVDANPNKRRLSMSNSRMSFVKDGAQSS